MTTQAEKGARFAALHARDKAFIIPNPWDVGTARLFQGMGFEALATTSAGFAFTLGKADSTPTLEEKLAHCEALAAGTDIPVAADFEDGFASRPEDVAANVTRLAGTGVVGCSIEDYDREAGSIHELELAVERVQAAVEAAAALDFPFTLTARAEHLLRGGKDVDDALRRLQAYEGAGAQVLYAPGLSSLDDIRTVTSSLERPVNVLAGFTPGARLADYEAAGVRRVSVGSLLTYVAADPVMAAADAMLADGSFDWIAQAGSAGRLQTLVKGG